TPGCCTALVNRPSLGAGHPSPPLALNRIEDHQPGKRPDEFVNELDPVVGVVAVPVLVRPQRQLPVATRYHLRRSRQRREITLGQVLCRPTSDLIGALMWNATIA